jgi:hypothetical protein
MRSSRVCLEHLAVDTAESEGRQVKQCRKTYIKIKYPKNPPLRKKINRKELNMYRVTHVWWPLLN